MATRSKSKDTDAKQQGYTVLARRYRSRDFDELIGQEPVARTLLNAIKTNRTAHAYLFCGTRGVGKTSMARIFAKALNATDDLKERDAIGEAILRGDDLDVIEIDAASNRGIDNARELIAGAGLSPARSPYKIYIVDEVHMLTREAFNALLKTMEEPPAHVKFILCTTEAHKVPATIQSRCQRFDFRPIPSGRIAEQLRMILKEEGIKADDAVVAQIARLGNGSMRDALSLMDRLLAGGNEKLTPQLLEEMLGLPDHTLVENLVEAIVAADPKNALEISAQLLAGGATVEQAIELLTEHFRTLMVIVACGEDCEFLDLSDESRKTAVRHAANFDAAGLVHMIALCDAVSRNAKGSTAARALFDAAIVRLSMSQHFADIPAMLANGGAAVKLPPAGVPSKPQPVKSTAAQIEPKKKEPVSPSEASWASEADEDPQREVRVPGPAATAEIKPLPVVSARLDAAPLTIDVIWARAWNAAQLVMQDKMKIQHLEPVSFDGHVLRLAVTPDGAGVVRFLQSNIDSIAELIKRTTGQSVRVELDIARVTGSAGAAHELQVDQSQRHPLVEKARELFDAVLVNVERVEERR